LLDDLLDDLGVDLLDVVGGDEALRGVSLPHVPPVAVGALQQDHHLQTSKQAIQFILFVLL
jgi:hypothetical protein